MRRPDGATVRWQSRQHRKQLNRLTAATSSTWWAPGAVAWWIAILFMVGSVCFALGSVPAYAASVGAAADGITFFVGSIFFTSAALLVYLEAVNSVRSLEDTPSRVRLLSWEPARIDWWAGLIQLAGTLFFNRSTFQALQTNLTASEANQMIWRPDVLGSICFLVASALAWAEAGHGWVSWKPREHLVVDRIAQPRSGLSPSGYRRSLPRSSPPTTSPAAWPSRTSAPSSVPSAFSWAPSFSSLSGHGVNRLRPMSAEGETAASVRPHRLPIQSRRQSAWQCTARSNRPRRQSHRPPHQTRSSPEPASRAPPDSKFPNRGCGPTPRTS